MVYLGPWVLLSPVYSLPSLRNECRPLLCNIILRTAWRPWTRLHHCKMQLSCGSQHSNLCCRHPLLQPDWVQIVHVNAHWEIAEYCAKMCCTILCISDLWSDREVLRGTWSNFVCRVNTVLVHRTKIKGFILELVTDRRSVSRTYMSSWPRRWALIQQQIYLCTLQIWFCQCSKPYSLSATQLGLLTAIEPLTFITVSSL